MIKLQSNNSFNDGLMMDMNPLITPNNVMTNCLNGTLITFNGNEYILLNDMGNGRIETAYLPEGYIPVGTALLGGIIYIVSYNPFKDLCLIGSFPSPERNFTTKELSGIAIDSIKDSDFKEGNNIKALSKLILLTPETKLFPGDKYIIYGTNINNNANNLSAYLEGNLSETDLNQFPRNLKLKIASIDDNGNIIFLKDLVWRDDKKYYIEDAGNAINESEAEEILKNTENIDDYRNIVNSTYNIFTTKTSGKLAVIASLEVINTFSVFWDVLYDNEKDKKITLKVNWTYNNENLDSRSRVNLDLIKIKEEIKEHIVQFYNKENNLADTKEYIITYEEKDFSSRKNDGTDENVEIENYSRLIDENTENNISLTVIPGMKFGWLEELKLTITIDTKLIGTGIMQLLQWKYYGNDNSIIINYGLNCNSEKNKTVLGIVFNFYKVEDKLLSTLLEQTKYFNIKDETYVKFKEANKVSDNNDIISEINLSPSFSKTISNKISYSGYDSIVLDYTLLEENKCYLVDIIINYKHDDKITRLHCYKILYTSSIFNDAYLTDCNDFGILKLSDYLKLDYKNNINNEVINIKNPELRISQYKQTQIEESGKLDYEINGVSTNELIISNPIFDIEVIECTTDEEEKFLFPIKESLNPIEGEHYKCDISFNINSRNLVNITDRYIDKISVPYNVIYSEKTNHIPSTLFINIKIASPIILGIIGKAKDIVLVYSGNSFINSDNTNDFTSYINIGSDGGSWLKPLCDLGNVYTSFKLDVIGYDVVPIAICSTRRDSGDNTFDFFIEDYSRGSGEDSSNTDSIIVKCNDNMVDNTRKSIIVSYALKGSDNNWNIFNKTKNDLDNRIYTKVYVYPASETTATYYTTPVNSNFTYSTGTSEFSYTSIDDCILKASELAEKYYFYKIYRVANELERLEIQSNYDSQFFTYNKINTYDNFLYQFTHNIIPKVKVYLGSLDISTIKGVPNLDVEEVKVNNYLFTYQVQINNNIIISLLNEDNNILIYNRYYDQNNLEYNWKYKIIDNSLYKNSLIIKFDNNEISSDPIFLTSGNSRPKIDSRSYKMSLSGGNLQLNDVVISSKYVYNASYRGLHIRLKVVP